MKTKTKKKTYTVRIEWPVTYYCDTVVKATDPHDAARIAMEDPDYDNQSSYDEPGDSTVEGVCEGDEYEFEQHIDVGDASSEAARERGPELLDALIELLPLAHQRLLDRFKVSVCGEDTGATLDSDGLPAGWSKAEHYRKAVQLVRQLTTGKEG